MRIVKGLHRALLGLIVLGATYGIPTDSPEVGTPWLYPGLAVFSFVWAFADAYAIGANDVANSFATAVASGTITHKQAVFIALFAEFFGALALGSSVTETIKKKVMDTSRFAHDPYVLMLAMACTSAGSAAWVLAATRLHMPVSTTHATVGALMGVGIAAFGPSGVLWDYDKGGFLSIMASWFLSPLLAGALAAAFYLTIRLCILDHPGDEPFRRGLASLPVYFGFTWGTICAFMMLKGSPALHLDKLPVAVSIAVTLVVAAAAAAFGRWCAAPWCRRVIGGGEEIPWYKMLVVAWVPQAPAGGGEEEEEDESGGSGIELVNGSSTPAGSDAAAGAAAGGDDGGGGGERWAGGGEEGDRVGLVPPPAAPGPLRGRPRGDSGGGGGKSLYQLLQVSTCSFASLAHGANDVANAVGPLAAVWMVYSTGRVSPTAAVPAWILAYGAVALDLGLLTYGHHIMRALGNKVTYHSPARGFCMELGAMFTVLTFSKLGVPVSTTHCICGATAAVGVCGGGGVAAVNWRMVATIVFGWVLTCPAAGLIAGGLFAAVAGSPRPVPGNGFFEL